MNNYVIDTNVLIVSNGKSERISRSDIQACTNFLLSILNNSIIAVDSIGLIFNEYFNNVRRAGQPGLGDYVAKWLWDNQFKKTVCERVDIVSLNKYHSEFEGISFSRGLESFDISDRKFVAVALKSRYNPEICNATDSDWWDFKNELSNRGIQVKFLCPNLVNEWNDKNDKK